MAEEGEVKQSRHLLAEASNHLAISLHKVLTKDGGNIFFSPVSISMAMAMLFRGAQGDTSEELRKVLGYDSVGLPDGEVHRRCHKMLGILSRENDSYMLAVANSIVHQKDFSVVEEFLSDMKELYQALVMEVDFSCNLEAAVNEINEWVKTQTRNMIPKVVTSLNPVTVMVLLNAVYFKGMWIQQFDPKNTRPGTFYNRGCKSAAKDVPMMHMSKKFMFVEKKDFKAIELPYQGDDIAMIILLPKKLDGLAAVKKHLKPDFISTLQKDFRKVKVDLTLPKLHLEYSRGLKDVFQKIGLSSIFQSGANLRGISEYEKIMVSEIMHKAVIDVNEEGSEAAAVTAVMIMQCCLMISPEFLVDHPFMFVIYDKRSNLIMFMGSVLEM